MPVIINGSTGVSGTDGSAGTPALQGTDGNTGMFFPAADQIAFAEGGVEAMRLDASGNVGIGTTMPGNKLTVAASGSSQVRVISLSGGTEYYDFGRDATDGLFAFNGAQTTFVGYKWLINNTERARITSGGRLLVGSSSIGGDGVISALGVFGLAASMTCAVNSTSAHTQIQFLNPNGMVGSIGTVGSSTSYNTSSDYRLKENVVPLADAAARVQALKPCRFNFIADPDRTVDGFLAHETAEVVPEAINGEKDAVDADGKPIYQGIDQSKLVPLLTAALQEALTEIAALKARVAALEATP